MYKKRTDYRGNKKKILTVAFYLYQMSTFDLNAPPTEDGDVPDMEPLYCTQAGPAEFVGESPDPAVDERAAPLGGQSDEQSGRGPQHNIELSPAGDHGIPASTIPTDSTTYPNLGEGDVDGAGMNEEVASSPQEPFLGMRSDTILSAKAHYNAYALKLGFSIKAHTSQKGRNTDQIVKQQFVCNKFRRPKTEEEEQQERMTIVEDISPVQLDDGDVEARKSGSSKKK